MPVVSFASPKGGVGKTTASLILATTFAARGARVVVLDCDPNQPLPRWGGTGRDGLAIVPRVTQDTLLATIDREAARHDLVVVDLEGAAARVLSHAIVRSELVVVPMKASVLDAAEAARAVQMVRQAEQAARRAIACRVLFTQTGHIATKAERVIKADLTAHGVGVFRTALASRVAFETMFAEKRTLRELDPAKVNGLAAAIGNAELFADEVGALLGQAGKGRAAA